MYNKKGALLEELVTALFKRAGFNVETYTNKYGFEVDVLATKGNYNIIIECKQYEAADLSVKSLLFEWESKGRFAKANKTIIITTARNVNKYHYELAKKLGVCLIDDNTLNMLNSLGDKKLKIRLNELIRFDSKGYWRRRIIKYLIYVLAIGLVLGLIYYKILK